MCSQKDYGIFFLCFCPYCFQLQKSLYLYPYPFLDVVATTTRERVVEAAAAFETTTSDTSLLTRPAGKSPTHRDIYQRSGEEEEQAYLRRTRGRHARPRGIQKIQGLKVQIPTELSYSFLTLACPAGQPSRPACPPRPSDRPPPSPQIVNSPTKSLCAVETSSPPACICTYVYICLRRQEWGRRPGAGGQADASAKPLTSLPSPTLKI